MKEENGDAHLASVAVAAPKFIRQRQLELAVNKDAVSTNHTNGTF